MVAVLGLQTIGSVAWTYSVHVIYWIRGQSWRFKPFVANSVGEIQPLWRYILLTRGLSVSALGEEGKWWSGPPLLKQDPSEWPQTRIVKREVRKLCQAKELRVEQTFASLITVGQLQPQRYSSWMKLTRTAAWVNPFIENCRLPIAILGSADITDAELLSAIVGAEG